MRLESCPSVVDQFFQAGMGTQVTFMYIGFIMMEAGSVSSRNVTNILFNTTFSAAICMIVWFLFGFALAFGSTVDDYSSFIGDKYFALHGLDTCFFSLFYFHSCFCTIANIIMTGTVAERGTVWTYALMSVLMSGFIYPTIVHWCWSDFGWLANGNGDWLVKQEKGGMGFQDYAGGLVHVTGGTSALVAAIVIGPRLRATEDDNPSEAPRKTKELKSLPQGHSIPFTTLGSLVIALGFISFNCGSGLKLDEDQHSLNFVSYAAVNTVLAGAGGALSAMLVDKIVVYYREPQSQSGWNLVRMLNGMLAGMVSICAGADSVSPWSSLTIGAIGGVSYLSMVYFCLKVELDDPVDAVAVHLCPAIWGMLARPLFHVDHGILFSFSKDSWSHFAWNLAGGVCIFVWTALWTTILLLILKKFNKLRVSELFEREGLDNFAHGQRAYDMGHNAQVSRDAGNLLELLAQKYEDTHGHKKKTGASRRRSHTLGPVGTPVAQPIFPPPKPLDSLAPVRPLDNEKPSLAASASKGRRASRHRSLTVGAPSAPPLFEDSEETPVAVHRSTENFNSHRGSLTDIRRSRSSSVNPPLPVFNPNLSGPPLPTFNTNPASPPLPNFNTSTETRSEPREVAPDSVPAAVEVPSAIPTSRRTRSRTGLAGPELPNFESRQNSASQPLPQEQSLSPADQAVSQVSPQVTRVSEAPAAPLSTADDSHAQEDAPHEPRTEITDNIQTTEL
eukprot:m.324739 g.324739  ORF g.324739 m.324739 type:complete len:730 (+) comp55542_c0_seq4:295-2484(+)